MMETKLSIVQLLNDALKSAGTQISSIMGDCLELAQKLSCPAF